MKIEDPIKILNETNDNLHEWRIPDIMIRILRKRNFLRNYFELSNFILKTYTMYKYALQMSYK